MPTVTKLMLSVDLIDQQITVYGLGFILTGKLGALTDDRAVLLNPTARHIIQRTSITAYTIHVVPSSPVAPGAPGIGTSPRDAPPE